MASLKSNRIIFFGKINDEYSNLAFIFLKKYFPNSKKIMTKNIIGEKININFKKFDCLISFKTKIIFKKKNLRDVKGYKLNFHTSLPDYPGSCGVNFSIYDKKRYFGTTVHHLNEKVDNGKIIYVKKQRITKKNMNIKNLIVATYKLQLNVFKLFIKKFYKDRNFVHKSEVFYKNYRWNSKTYKLKDLKNLCKIPKNATNEKINRIISSCNFGDFKPYILKKGKKFYYLG